MRIIILKVMDLSVSWLILGFPHHESFFLLTIDYHPCLIDEWQNLFDYTDLYSLFVVSMDQLNLHFFLNSQVWNSFLPTPRFCISSRFWNFHYMLLQLTLIWEKLHLRSYIVFDALIILSWKAMEFLMSQTNSVPEAKTHRL